jgi:hypothetical protein
MRSSFGFASRHRIEFNQKTKQGLLLIWSYYDGFLSGKSPLIDGYGSSADEILALLLRVVSYRVNLPLGGINDLLSILAAIALARQGKVFSFSNYEDRLVSFQPAKEGEQQIEVIHVKIRYNSNVGKLVGYEISELERVIKHFIINLGISGQEITYKLENIIKQYPNYTS